MATRTTNYGLYMPDPTDPFEDFQAEHNANMRIIDQNLGGGGGGGSSSLAGLTDVNLTTPTDGQVLSYDGNNSKWVNGAVVFLSEYASAVYSNNEREVGCWTDGKPLYQKTVHINALPDSSQIGQYVDYPHGISDIDEIVDYEGIVHFPTSPYNNALKINRSSFNTNGFNYQASFDGYVNRNAIRILVGQDRSTTNADFTIWYTKTTDVAGSGKLVPSAMPSVHYSTNEQVIGTWIDGKPLYEKTIDIPNTSQINNSFVYPHGISDYEMAMICNAFTVDYVNGSVFILTLSANDDKTLSVRLDPTNIFFRGSNLLNIFATRHLYVIIRYTKTTD